MTPEEKFYKEQDTSRQFHGLSADDEKELLARFPDKKYFEFVYDKWINRESRPFDQKGIEQSYSQWKPWEAWSYPIDDLIRYRHMILDNEEMIKDKKVADIGSHLGIGVLFALHLGANRCIGVEPFEMKNTLASLICEKAGFTNYNIMTGELRQEEIYQKMNGFDTAILGSIIDMIPSHYQLIENLAMTGIGNIIIEMEEVENSENDVPHIKWRYYTDDPLHHGPLVKKGGNGLHGYPNIAFLKILLGNFGYRLQKRIKFYVNTNNQKPTQRSVSVFVLDQVDETGKDVNLKND